MSSKIYANISLHRLNQREQDMRVRWRRLCRDDWGKQNKTGKISSSALERLIPWWDIPRGLFMYVEIDKAYFLLQDIPETIYFHSILLPPGIFYGSNDNSDPCSSHRKLAMKKKVLMPSQEGRRLSPLFMGIERQNSQRHPFSHESFVPNESAKSLLQKYLKAFKSVA